MIKEFTYFGGGIAMAAVLYGFSGGQSQTEVVETRSEAILAAPVSVPVAAQDNDWESDYDEDVDADSADSTVFGEPTMIVAENMEAYEDSPGDSRKSGPAGGSVVAAAVGESPDRLENAGRIKKMNQSPPSLVS